MKLRGYKIYDNKDRYMRLMYICVGYV